MAGGREARSRRPRRATADVGVASVPAAQDAETWTVAVSRRYPARRARPLAERTTAGCGGGGCWFVASTTRLPFVGSGSSGGTDALFPIRTNRHRGLRRSRGDRSRHHAGASTPIRQSSDPVASCRESLDEFSCVVNNKRVARVVNIRDIQDRGEAAISAAGTHLCKGMGRRARRGGAEARSPSSRSSPGATGVEEVATGARHDPTEGEGHAQ